MNVHLFIKGVGVSIALAFALSGSTVLQAGASDGVVNHTGMAYEAALVDIVNMLQQGELESALQLTERHLEEFPKSQVGHLIRADVLHAMSASKPQLGPVTAQQSKELIGLKHQIKNRWLHDQVHDQTAGKLVPANLVMMGAHRYVLVADLEYGRLYLYANTNGKASLIRDYYLSVGKAGYGKRVEGDNKTPVGVYSIIKHIEGAKLPDLYGRGAFPIDYPNRYDKSLKRTGYGIWLHGTPSDTYARAPWSSEGCFVLSNDDLLDIQNYLKVDTRPPVILSDSIEWIDRTELAARKKGYLQVLSRWKTDWESLNVDAYLNRYSREKLNFGSAEYQSWAKRKNESKSFVKTKLIIQSLFLYPGEDDMFIVKFKQSDLNNDFAIESHKQQYWQRDSLGQWKIVYEGQG